MGFGLGPQVWQVGRGEGERVEMSRSEMAKARGVFTESLHAEAVTSPSAEARLTFLPSSCVGGGGGSGAAVERRTRVSEPKRLRALARTG